MKVTVTFEFDNVTTEKDRILTIAKLLDDLTVMDNMGYDWYMEESDENN